MDWLYSLSGFLVGLVVGVTGVGGGSLMTPLLVLVFGVAPVTAVGTDLLFAALTKTGGAWAHARCGPWGLGHGFLGRRWCAGRDSPVFSLPGPCGCAHRRHRHRPCRAAHPGRGAGACCGRGGGLETAGRPHHRLAAGHLARQRAQPADPGTAAARCARCDADPDRRQTRVVGPMYLYDEIDQKLVDERVAQFRDQTRRFLAGKLSDDEFRALRLRNGLYIQRYAPMLRIAIPYGLLSTKQ